MAELQCHIDDISGQGESTGAYDREIVLVQCLMTTARQIETRTPHEGGREEREACERTRLVSSDEQIDVIIVH